MAIKEEDEGIDEERDKEGIDPSSSSQNFAEQIQSELQRMEESRPEIAVEEEEKINNEVRLENVAENQFPV